MLCLRNMNPCMNQMHPQAQAVSLPWQVIDKVANLLLLLARTYLFEKTLTVKSKNRRMYVDYALDSHHILLIQGVETTSAVTKLGSRDPARQKQQARTIDTNRGNGTTKTPTSLCRPRTGKHKKGGTPWTTGISLRYSNLRSRNRTST